MPRGKKTSSKVDHQKVKFTAVDSRKMTQYEADLTEGSKTIGPIKNEDDNEFHDAVVKPVIRYSEGDEARADKVAERMVRQAREEGAVHVYRPERIVVGRGKVRAPDLKPETPPLEAAQLWMKEKKPPSGLDKKEVLDYVEACLGSVPRGSFQRIEPVPFVYRVLGGENYGPFRNTWKLEIPGTGVFAITGRYEGEAGRSNRSGKSALAGVARYPVYGESEYGRDQDKLVHTGEDKMEAYAELACGPASVRCRFGRKYRCGGSAKMYIGGDAFKKSDFDEARDEALALSHEDFVRTCFVREGDLHGLLGQGSAQIKSDMMRWLGLSGWTVVNKTVGEDLKENQAKCDALFAERAVNQGRMDDVDVGVVQIEIDDLKVKVEELELVNKQGDERLAVICDLERRIKVAESVEDALKVVKGEKACRARLKAAVSKRDKAEDEASKLREQIGALKSDVSECNKNMAGFDGQCPVDDEPCPRVHEINSDDGTMKEKLHFMQKALTKEQIDFAGVLKVRGENADIVDEVTRELRDIDAAEDLLDQQGRKPESVEALRKKMKAVGDTGGIIARGDSLRETRDRLDDLRAELKMVDKAAAEVERIDAALTTLNNEARLLRYAQLLTGKRGVPAMQIEGSARVVEGMANEVLAAMGQDHRLEFAFERELKKKETECSGCGRPWESGERKCPECSGERGNAIEDVFLPMVREGSKTQSFDQDSSGGKAMLALAVRVALARFLGVVILLLDETDRAFDDYNLEAFVKMLPRLLDQGFKQVFVISHRQYVRDKLEKCIEAVRHDGWSEVKWA